MARSRVGGTSAKISGVLGSLLFTVGKNSAGDFTQYIASYTGVRENPNTKYQALARMQIALIERMVQILTPVLQNSFEGIASGVNSINEFARVNMKQIQSYCETYWSEAYGWCFPTKGEPFTAWAPLIISEGSFRAPSCVEVVAGAAPHYRRRIRITLPAGAFRYVDIRKALGISKNGSFNLVLMFGEYTQYKTGGGMIKCKLNTRINDYTDIRTLNPEDLFVCESKIFDTPFSGQTNLISGIQYTESNNTIVINTRVTTSNGNGTFETDNLLHALIWSDKKRTKWVKSTEMLLPPEVYSEGMEFGRGPWEAYYTWDENYDGESYQEYFGRKTKK